MGGSQYSAVLHEPKQNLFLCGASDGVASRSSEPAEDWLLQIRYHGEGRISIMSRHNQYLSVGPDGTICFISEQPTESELFTIMGRQCSKLSLVSTLGTFLNFDPEGINLIKKDVNFEDFDSIWEEDNCTFNFRRATVDPRFSPFLSRQLTEDQLTDENVQQGRDQQCDNMKSETKDIIVVESQRAELRKLVSNTNRVHPSTDQGDVAKGPAGQDQLPDRAEFWILEKDEIKRADIELTTFLINQFSKTGLTETERIQLYDLIETLTDFDRLKDLQTTGVSTDEFEELTKLFIPLNFLLFSKGIDNIWKMYDILMVKIKDVERLKLDKNKPSSQSHWSHGIMREKFSTDREGVETINVDYYICLVKQVFDSTLHQELDRMNPIDLDRKSAQTLYAKCHSQFLFNKVLLMLIANGVVQLSFTVVLSSHILSWNNENSNDVLIPLLLFLELILIICTPTIQTLVFYIISITISLFLRNPSQKERYDNWAEYYKNILTAYFSEFWRFVAQGQQLLALVYIILYYSDYDDHVTKALASLLCFITYLRLLSFCRFSTETRKIAAIMVKVAQQSVYFYLVLMLIIISLTFSTMALRDEDQYDFQTSFQLSYRLALGDFEDPEQYSSIPQLIGFLVGTLFGPILLLNLLVAVMGEAQSQILESMDTQSIKEVYMVAQEMYAMLFGIRGIFIFSPKIRHWIENFAWSTGWLHYCVPDTTEEALDDESDEWAGQTRKISSYIKKSERELKSYIKGTFEESRRDSKRDYKGHDDEIEPGMSHSIGSIEKPIGKQDLETRIEESLYFNRMLQDKMKQNMDEMKQNMDEMKQNMDEMKQNMDDKLQLLEETMNQKTDQVIELLKDSRASS